MKTIKLLGVLLCWCAAPVFARPISTQPVSVAQTYNNKVILPAGKSAIHLVAHRQAEHAAIMWRVDVPGNYVGFDIERSYDGEFFEVIGSYESNNESVHRAVDREVFPGVILYRIKAYLENGDEIYSNVSEVRIIKRK